MADGEPRPRWSVMIPAFDCASYLPAALESVLAQDPGPAEMQIEVVDDASSDDAERVVADVGAGRVAYFRQPENVGHVSNFNTCLERARGRLVHLLHGDDAVREGFYRTMERPFEEHPEIGAAFCRYISVDAAGSWETIAPLEQPQAGLLEGWLERIALGQRLQTPSFVARREVYERVGGFDTRLNRRLGEDWEMWVRIAARYPVWYEPEPLALYRVHDSVITGSRFQSGQNVRDLLAVIEINREALPPERADEISRRARELTAVTAIRRASRMLHTGERETIRAQVREALRASRSLPVLERYAAFLALRARRRLLDARARTRR